MGGCLIHQAMIEAHIIAFNEAETIHFTIQHYQAFCSKIVLWDNHSTDNTREIAKSMHCVVKTFGMEGELSDRAYLDLKNSCWKKSHPGHDRRDWVIIVDADEILHGGIPETNGTIFKTRGWNVFSLLMPETHWLEITHGLPDENYSKTVIFDPKAITDINYRIGCHVSSPRGNVQWADETLTLFHYRNVGGPGRLIERHNLYRPRMSQENIIRNWGHHYLASDEERMKEWKEKYERSRPFSRDGF